MPLEFRLGRREGGTQIDAIIFHQNGSLSAFQLDAILASSAVVPEPSSATLVLIVGVCALSRRRLPGRAEELSKKTCHSPSCAAEPKADWLLATETLVTKRVLEHVSRRKSYEQNRSFRVPETDVIGESLTVPVSRLGNRRRSSLRNSFADRYRLHFWSTKQLPI